METDFRMKGWSSISVNDISGGAQDEKLKGHRLETATDQRFIS
jgi:hypothetical protein